MIIGEPFALFAFWTRDVPLTSLQTVLLPAIFVGGTVMGGLLIAAPLRQRIILHEDSIEVVGTIFTRRLSYYEIGAKMAVPAKWQTWSIIPKERSQRRVMFEMSYDFDDVFWDWFNAIPKADDAFWKNRRRGGQA
jgi:hypothetical protein